MCCEVNYCISKWVLCQPPDTLTGVKVRLWWQLKLWFAKVIACFINTFNGQSMQRQVHWLLIDHEWIPQWEEIRSRLQRSFRQPAGPATGCHKCFIMFRWVRYWFTVKYFRTLSFFFYYIMIFYPLSSYTESKITWSDQSGPLYWTPQRSPASTRPLRLCSLYCIFHLIGVALLPAKLTVWLLIYCLSSHQHPFHLEIGFFFLFSSSHGLLFICVYTTSFVRLEVDMNEETFHLTVLLIRLWHLRPTCKLCPLESRHARLSFIICLIFLNIHLTGNSERARNNENVSVIFSSSWSCTRLKHCSKWRYTEKEHERGSMSVCQGWRKTDVYVSCGFSWELWETFGSPVL